MTDTEHVPLAKEVFAALEAEDLLPISEQDRDLAVSALAEAIQDYLRHLDPEVAVTRKELSALAKKVESALEQLASLSPQSLTLFCDAANDSRGTSTQRLREILIVTRTALTDAIELPNKQPNSPLTILAYEVARVMRDILRIRPTLTRDNTEFRVGERGGAAYARLLRKILFVAGEEPADDPLPLLARGLALLENPRGDSVS
jgi:hypothetical protein